MNILRFNSKLKTIFFHQSTQNLRRTVVLSTLQINEIIFYLRSNQLS